MAKRLHNCDIAPFALYQGSIILLNVAIEIGIIAQQLSIKLSSSTRSNMSEVTANYDESWKEALNEYFESFLSFFFPNIHSLIDWNKTPVARDKEFQQLKADYPPDLRVADKLYQVWLINPKKLFHPHSLRGSKSV